MKIIFTLTYYFPYISGLTIHVQRLAGKFASLGHKIEILTSQYQKDLSRFELRKKVSIVRVPYLFKLSKGFFMPMYIFYALLSVKKNDVVVVNLPQFEGFINAVIARLLNKRLYCIYHCEINLTKNVINFLAENMLHISSIITLLCSHKIITYTEDFAKHSKLLPYFYQKVVVLYPPISIPAINKKLQDELNNKLPKEKKYVIGVAARIAAEKGIEYLIESIPFLKERLERDFVIVIAGPRHPVGEEKYWHEITPLFKKYDKYLVFLGTVSPEQMGSFYSLLDVLVLPSVNSTEAFGMVQVEAMFCGVPVVASNLPGVRVPIITTGMGELAEPKNSQDLAEKIITVLTNRVKYMKDKKRVERIFNFNDTIARYEKLFSSLNNISIGK